MSEMLIQQRRDRAEKAARDVNGDPCEVDGQALTAAVKVATTVQLTGDLIEAAGVAAGHIWRNEAEAIARAVLEAAGFEVTT